MYYSQCNCICLSDIANSFKLIVLNPYVHAIQPFCENCYEFHDVAKWLILAM